jgi:argininosuccinate lyase
MALPDLTKISSAFEGDFSSGLNVESALAAKAVAGGTARDTVRKACEQLENYLTKLGAKT